LSKKAQAVSQHVADFVQFSAAEFRRRAKEHPSDLSVCTKLYATNQTLLWAMQRNRVGSGLLEICANLLACEEVAIVEIECKTGTIRFVGEKGLLPEKRAALIQNPQLLESRIEPGRAVIPADGGEDSSALQALGINAIVPLWASEKSKAAMLLFQLLPQRTAFDAEDREVLQLLSIYAGPCLRNQNLG